MNLNPLFESPISCSVEDFEGISCDEPIARILLIDGTEYPFCEKCYENVANGYYGKIDFILIE